MTQTTTSHRISTRSTGCALLPLLTPTPRSLIQDKGDDSEAAEIYKSTHEGPFKKYVPSQPTSPHWYRAESLRVLVFSHIGHARKGGRDLPLGEFVRQFQGLTSTAKAKALGFVGEEHFKIFFERVYGSVIEYKYVRKSGALPSGLPFTFEFALATLDEPGHLYCGINFSPSFGDP